MLDDDLDLGWEEGDSRRSRRGGPPSRQTRQRRRTQKKRRGRSFGALFVSMVLLVALGGGVYWGVGRLQEFFGAPDYTGQPTSTEVNVKVDPGDGSLEIGQELFGKKVIKSVKAFVNTARDDDRSRSIQPGTYRLFEQMPAKVALEALLDPEKNMLLNKVVVPEGKTAIDTFALLSKATGIPVADFTAAAKDPIALGVQDWWFKRDDGKKAVKSIEGFLFPDTYRFDPGLTAAQILTQMVNQFNTVVGELNFAETVQTGLSISPHEALVAASLAQVEAGKATDFGKIARVAYNRAYEDFPCNCLGFDVTVNYWLQLQGKPTKASKDMTENRPAQREEPLQHP